MTKSISAGAMLLLLIPQIAATQPMNSDGALEQYRATFALVNQLPCADADDANEIVVCGRRDDAPNPNRLPLPVEPEIGAIDRSDTSGRAAMGAGGCLRLCPGFVGLRLTLRAGKAKVAGMPD